jgi:hypothetical protein
MLMSLTVLQWLAGRLVEAAGQALADWMLDTCNTKPSALQPRRRLNTITGIRFAITMFWVNADLERTRVSWNRPRRDSEEIG